MRHWHKRVAVGSFFDLSEADQAAEWNDEDNAEELAFLIAKDGEYWNLDLFMRTEGRYDGVMGLTNTSAIGCIFSSCGDSAVIQCFS